MKTSDTSIAMYRKGGFFATGTCARKLAYAEVNAPGMPPAFPSTTPIMIAEPASMMMPWKKSVIVIAKYPPSTR